MEDVSNTLQQMQEKEDNITEDLINLKKEFITKLDGKVDNMANDNLDAAIKTVHDMISSLRLDVEARHRKVDEILSTMRNDITSVETNLEKSKAKVAMDTDNAINALNGRIDFTNKDLLATQESLHTTRNSLSDCFNEVALVRSDLERTVADTEAVQNCLQYLGEKIEALEVGQSLQQRGTHIGPDAIDKMEVTWGTKSETSISDGSPTWSEPPEPAHQENFFGL
mmetsp:Transcript_18600/g.30504  ORF Transcript_18600/g.30504 Transcript_18600/m.30504 type:complete len:225 (-) Transcript_18600:40-714(-)